MGVRRFGGPEPAREPARGGDAWSGRRRPATGILHCRRPHGGSADAGVTLAGRDVELVLGGTPVAVEDAGTGGPEPPVHDRADDGPGAARSALRAGGHVAVDRGVRAPTADAHVVPSRGRRRVRHRLCAGRQLTGEGVVARPAVDDVVVEAAGEEVSPAVSLEGVTPEATDHLVVA